MQGQSTDCDMANLENYLDQGTGTYYNYFRDYDPALGRYVQSDPIGLDDGVNTYGYVSGSPLSLTDRLGLKIDWGNFVVSNPRVRSNFERLNALVVETGIDDECFVLLVTGGDRYRRSPKKPNEHRSATNDRVISESDARSPHLVDNGGRALDFAVVNKKKDCCAKTVTEDLVISLLPKTEFEPSSTRREYPKAPHLHINLPNRREFYLWR